MVKTVRVLFFAGCPNHERTVELVRKAARRMQASCVVEEIEVRDATDAVRLRFLGSPTVQVDGVDIEIDRRQDESYAMGCRLYGGFGALSEEMIARALHEVTP